MAKCRKGERIREKRTHREKEEKGKDKKGYEKC